jgi:hypothetical protein
MNLHAMGFMKAAALVGLVSLLATMNLSASRAYAQHVGQAVAPPPVPTTRILAIGRLTAKATPAATRSCHWRFAPPPVFISPE